MTTQKFGLEAILSTKLDSTSLRSNAKEIETTFDKAATMEPEVRTGALERQMGRMGSLAGATIYEGMDRGSRAAERRMAQRGGALGQAVAGGIGGRAGAMAGRGTARVTGAAAGGASRAMTALGGALSGGLLMVGLAGAVGIGILKATQALAQHSPALATSLKIIGMAWSLFWRPFGNALASLLFPMAKHLLKFAVAWNKWAKEGGLVNAFIKAGESIGRWIYNYFASNLSNLLGGNSTEGRNSGARLGTLAGGAIGGLLGGPVGMVVGAVVGNIIGQIGGALIGKLNELDWRGLLGEAFGPAGVAFSDTIHAIFPDLKAGEVLAAIAFPTIGAQLLLSHINWPNLQNAASGVGAFGDALRSFVRWIDSLPFVDLDLPEETSTGNTNTGVSATRTVNVSSPTSGGAGYDGGFATTDPQFIDNEGTSGSYGPGYRSGRDIPLLATGGVVTRPTQAIVGEAGTEAIIPLERLPRMMAEGLKTAGEGSGTTADMSGVERKLEDILRALKETAGDVVVNLDGETIARTSKTAGDRFVSRSEVYR